MKESNDYLYIYFVIFILSNQTYSPASNTALNKVI